MSVLNSSIKVGDLELKNRLVMPPMATSKAADDGQIATEENMNRINVLFLNNE